jgi:hypothetical protein
VFHHGRVDLVHEPALISGLARPGRVVPARPARERVLVGFEKLRERDNIAASELPFADSDHLAACDDAASVFRKRINAQSI